MNLHIKANQHSACHDNSANYFYSMAIMQRETEIKELNNTVIIIYRNKRLMKLSMAEDDLDVTYNMSNEV